MADGFGDKEVLFHLLLAPFAGLARDPVRGGQVALALLLAALFATMSVAARRTLGGWAILLPWWLAFASTELAWRWVRLRPELLSLVLLVCALEAIARRRYRLLGAIAALYALSYTAFHAFVGLCVLIFLFAGWARRRWEWPLPVYAVAGTAVGLLVHPHFPKNLEIWALQTFEYFRYRSVLDVGSEITPNYTDVTLMVNLGWALGLGVLWLSSRPDPTAETQPSGVDLDRRLADAYGVAAVVFSVLYLLMSRFSLYALSFATLWVLDSIRARGRSIGGRTRLPWRRAEVPLALAAAACIAVSAPEALRQWKNYDLRTQAGPGQVRLRDREAFSAALPPGALVAAPWQQTSIYMLWAPQALYLNVLDPVFLAARDPARHTAQANVFSGEEPDVPLAVAVALDSQLLAYSPYAGLDLLTARLEHDPRVAIRHRLHGFNLLWTILPDRNDAFILDWFELPSKKDEVLRPRQRTSTRRLCAATLAGRSDGGPGWRATSTPAVSTMGPAASRSPTPSPPPSRSIGRSSSRRGGPRRRGSTGTKSPASAASPRPCSDAASTSLSIWSPATICSRCGPAPARTRRVRAGSTCDARGDQRQRAAVAGVVKR